MSNTAPFKSEEAATKFFLAAFFTGNSLQCNDVATSVKEGFDAANLFMTHAKAEDLIE